MVLKLSKKLNLSGPVAEMERFIEGIASVRTKNPEIGLYMYSQRHQIFEEKKNALINAGIEIAEYEIRYMEVCE